MAVEKGKTASNGKNEKTIVITSIASDLVDNEILRLEALGIPASIKGVVSSVLVKVLGASALSSEGGI